MTKYNSAINITLKDISKLYIHSKKININIPRRKKVAKINVKIPVKKCLPNNNDVDIPVTKYNNKPSKNNNNSSKNNPPNNNNNIIINNIMMMSTYL